MSKSLKNFVTIDEVLREYRPQAVRFLCTSTTSRWSTREHHGRGRRPRAALCLLFRLAANAAARGGSARAEGEAPTHKWAAEERTLSETLRAKRTVVDVALRDIVDTPAALKALEQLIRAANTPWELSTIRGAATLLASVSLSMQSWAARRQL